jgi:hypothetical protein
MTHAISGWKIAADDRDRLLALFPPRYAQTVADHVTYRYGAGENAELPKLTAGEIVGEADDGSGVQALVVSIGGTTERGDGSHFHITWSLGQGRRAKESNDVITAQGWKTAVSPEPVALQPARWRG